MRAVLFLLAIVVLVLIALVALGVIDIRQTREGRMPEVGGGQTPAVDVNVNPVEIGTERRNVEIPVPTVRQRDAEIVEPVEPVDPAVVNAQ